MPSKLTRSRSVAFSAGKVAQLGPIGDAAITSADSGQGHEINWLVEIEPADEHGELSDNWTVRAVFKDGPGVKKTASQDDIQTAYRRLAKKLQPDLNPGNKQTEERFKEVSADSDLLGDGAKRAPQRSRRNRRVSAERRRRGIPSDPAAKGAG